MTRVATAEQVLAHDPVDPASIHMPSPSYFPMVASLGLPIMAYGMIYRAYAFAVIGALAIVGGIFAWTFEPSAAPHDDHGHNDDDGGHDDGGHDDGHGPDAGEPVLAGVGAGPTDNATTEETQS